MIEIALNGKYVVAAKLLNSPRKFLAKPTKKGNSNLHFLGVSSEVFDELAAQAPETVHEYGEHPDEFSRDFDREAHVRPVARDEMDLDWRETFRGNLRHRRRAGRRAADGSASRAGDRCPATVRSRRGPTRPLLARLWRVGGDQGAPPAQAQARLTHRGAQVSSTRATAASSSDCTRRSFSAGSTICSARLTGR